LYNWKGVIWDFVDAIILLVSARCAVPVREKQMILAQRDKMELYCERCYFVFEKRYRCRVARNRWLLSGKTLRWKQRREGVVSSGKFLGIDYSCPIGN
jgi:hypothetical protein